jgi:starch synthase (maltosyl-transferring)
VGEDVADGHDVLFAVLLYRSAKDRGWCESPMVHVENDRWRGVFRVGEVGVYLYTVEGWVDQFKTWQNGLRKKVDAGASVGVELLVGAGILRSAMERASSGERARLRDFVDILEGKGGRGAVEAALCEELTLIMSRYPDRSLSTVYGRELRVVVDRRKALFSAWYECFPRSCSAEPGRHGTFRDLEGLLAFSPFAGPDDVGSSWAAGSVDEGHKSIHPSLGGMDDFEALVISVARYGIEIALDVAFRALLATPT